VLNGAWIATTQTANPFIHISVNELGAVRGLVFSRACTAEAVVALVRCPAACLRLCLHRKSM
jgi:hypothetical protein